jgi:hypothetical protein
VALGRDEGTIGVAERDWHCVAAEGRDDWHPSIAALWEYLVDSHGGAGPFRRRQFDPIDVPTLLPCMWIFDVLRDPTDFNYRVVGTKMVEAQGEERTGQRLSQIFPEPARTIRAAWIRLEFMADTGRPTWRRGLSIAERREAGDTVENLMVPFLDADGRTEMILGYSVYIRPSGEEF